MVIISKTNHRPGISFRNSQFRYSILYAALTLILLLFLNVYCANAGRNVFYNSKKTTLKELGSIAASNIADTEVLSTSTIDSAINQLVDRSVARIIVTSESCIVLYDSNQGELVEKYLLYPEVITALKGNSVFRWYYNKGVMRSFIACPIVSHGKLIGCVYINENDPEQGILLQTLQRTVFLITVFLEIVVIFLSILFSKAYTRRLRKVMDSIHKVRDGDYTHKLSLSGNDELNILGDEFNELVTRLDTSEKKRNRFVSDASHELKTPLASIKLLSDSILQNEMDQETVKEFVGDIGNEAERLNRLSQKLLTLSQIDNHNEMPQQQAQLLPVAQRVVRMLQPTAEKNGIQINLNCDPIFYVAIAADDLYQVLFNLTENAIKYNKQNGTVQLRAEKDQDFVTTHVSDTGLGIPDDSISHIFERFYRVDKARSRSTGGSGLGLSIVRNIVKQAGGRIHVDSQPDVGTTISISLPSSEKEVTQ